MAGCRVVLLLCLFQIGCKVRSESSAVASTIEEKAVWLDKEGEITADVLFSRLLAADIGKFSDVNDLLFVLPEYFFSQQNAVLLKNSGAECREVVDPSMPRVVIFDSKSRLVLSYVGSPEDSECYSSLRVIQGDPDVPYRYSFYNVSFAQASKPQVSQRNPPECESCHEGQPMTVTNLEIPSFRGELFPIWNATGSPVKGDWWPGAFGGSTSYVSSPAEIAELKAFGRSAKQWPRYNRIRGDYIDLDKNPASTAQVDLGTFSHGYSTPHANALSALDSIFAPAFLMPDFTAYPKVSKPGDSKPEAIGR